jgi:hypothetical protein
VIGSIALGVGPLPFLAVYASLFIAHGFIYPVQPPDITGTALGEGISGIVAVVLFLLGTVTIFWFLNASRRWPFVLGQLATLVTAIDFTLDPTIGARSVSVMLALTSGVALVLAAMPSTWAYMGWARGEPAAEALPVHSDVAA